MSYKLDDLEVYKRAESLSDKIWIEVTSWKDYFIMKLKNRKIIEEKKANEFIEELTQIHRMLNSYIKFIGTTNTTSTNSQ